MAESLNDAGAQPKGRGGRTRKPTAAPPVVPQSNLTDETIQQAGMELLDIHNELAEAQEEKSKAARTCNEINGRYRNALKKWKKLGVSEQAMVWWLGARKLDPAEIDRETRERNRVARAMGLPIGTQLGFFDDGKTVATHVDDQAQLDAGDAFDFGYEMGLGGKNVTDQKRYNDQHPNWTEFLRGHKQGQGELMRKDGAPTAEATA